MPILIANRSISNKEILEILKTQSIKFKIGKNPTKKINELINAGYTVTLQIGDKAIVFLR